MKPVIVTALLLFLYAFPATSQQVKPCNRISGPYLHVVQSGETLMSISRKYSMDTTELIIWNQIQDASKIRRCQNIVLIEPGIYRQRVRNRDTRMPGPGILSLATSNSFKNQMDSMKFALQNFYFKDASGELAYYLPGPWFPNSKLLYPETHFKNTETDMRAFLLQMHQLGLILKKKELSNQDKLNIRNTVKKLNNSNIKPVYANGLPVKERPKTPINPTIGPRVHLAAWQIVDSTNSPIPNTTVYLIQVKAFIQCPCEDCFAEKKDACDIHQLEAFMVKKDGADYWVSAGPYHLFVTKKVGLIEKVIHYEKKKVTYMDSGKPTTIVAKGR